jgi:hypothetical protein
MLGVLLATARPGQRTPGLGQAVNLAACGLAIRVRRIPGWLAADAGQDALAVVSLIAPAVVFILLALGWAVNAAAGARVLPRVPVWTPLLPVPVLPFSGESVVVMIAWLAVVVLGLTGRQRTAAKIAFISLTLALLALLLVLVVLIQQVHSFYFNTFPGELFQFLPFGDVPVVLASLAACSLALSPGPRRGLAIVGWRRACLMIAGLPPAGRPGDRGRGRRHVRPRPGGPTGRGAGGGRAPARSRRRHPAARCSGGLPGARARQPVRRRAGVAGGDRILAGAGGTPPAAGRAGPGFHRSLRRSLRRVPGLLRSPAAARFLNPATGAGLGRLAGRAIPTRRDQPMARLRRQPVPAALTTTPCHSAHQGSSGNWTP